MTGAPADGRRLRILFQFPYPGYLRIYGSTVAELARRGHTVLLAYDLAEKRRDAAAAEVEALPGVELIAPLPWGQAGVGAVAQVVRPTLDYLRYLNPRFAGAPYLRERMEKFVPPVVLRLTRAPASTQIAPAVMALLRAVDRALPANPATVRGLAALRPDVAVVSPLIARGPSGTRQEDTVRAARRLGVPVAAAITSWDHLTTKGVVKTVPDRVFVWNEVQRREAVELHGVPDERIVVTGAQLFDHWFDREPTVAREEFVAGLGLDPAQPYVLYVGSSPNVTEAAREERWVRAWISAVRASRLPEVERVGVVVRPHPGNAPHWGSVDLSAIGGTVVPRARPQIPMTRADEELYFLTIHHAATVVGINTSAIIESLIQRRPVLTVRAPEFRSTQEGTLHFHYLTPEGGGCIRSAVSLAEHVVQLRDAIAAPDREVPAIERFLRSFVRPRGLNRPATPILGDAVEALALR